MQIIDGNVYQDTWNPAYGLGDMTTSGIASVAAQGAATTASLTGGLVSLLGGGMGATFLGISAAAFPIIGAAIAGLTAVGIAIAKAFAGCGQTCVQASHIADQVEQILIQNLQHYVGSPVRYQSMQAAALNNFDTAWQALVQACGQQALMQAGVNCIQDRSQGSCKWKATPGGWSSDGQTWTPAGAAGSGSTCWNWFVGYRDPIVNDPGVRPDPVVGAAGGNDSATSNAGAGAGTGDPISNFLNSFTDPATGSSSVMVGTTKIPLMALVGGGLLLLALSMGDK